MFYILLIVLFMSLDLFFKFIIEKLPKDFFPKNSRLLGMKIRIDRVFNYGFPMGFMKDYRNIIKYIPLLISGIVFLFFSFLLPKKRPFSKLSLSLILGGALSNLYDRFKRGYVVDYFSFRYKVLEKIVFNLGDIFIFTGSILYLINSVLKDIIKFFKALSFRGN